MPALLRYCITWQVYCWRVAPQQSSRPLQLARAKITLFSPQLNIIHWKKSHFDFECGIMSPLEKASCRQASCMNPTEETQKSPKNGAFSSCGVREIRTPEPLLTVTRFPGVPLQPLEHLSLLNCGCKGNTFLRIMQIYFLFSMPMMYAVVPSTVNFTFHPSYVMP